MKKHRPIKLKEIVDTNRKESLKKLNVIGRSLVEKLKEKAHQNGDIN